MDEDALSGALRFGQGAAASGEVAGPGIGADAPTRASRAPAPALEQASARSPQLALRARLNAFVVDGLILGVVTVPLVGRPQESLSVLDRFLLGFAIQFAYFYLWEARRGQTLGKRIFHVHVTSLDGSPASPRQVAVRNALRALDALPLMYASGLISMMRTGRARRQRIGDVLAGTTVVLDAGGTPHPTPRWLLPTITFIAIFLSVAVIVPALKGRSQAGPPLPAPRPPSASVALGRSGAGPEPMSGSWLASVTTTHSIGYSNEHPRTESFEIARHCGGGRACALALTLRPPGESPIAAPLIHTRAGWLAALPVRSYPCGQTAAGRTIYWSQHTTIAFHFSDRGRSGQAEELDASYKEGCGYGTATSVWTAALR